MIISHKYKYIFLKTNKTAGTSIEIALSKFCEPNDIITPISPEDEEIRNNLGFLGAQNYLSSVTQEQLFYNHISAEEVKKLIGNKIWNTYYKFCFVRNPWDRIISLYYWIYQSDLRPSIAEYLETDYPLRLKQRGLDLYRINGEISVDNVYRFENIQEEVETMRKKVGIPEKLILPRAKSKFRKDKRHYRDILTEEERLKVAELFSEEIKLFNYSF